MTGSWVQLSPDPWNEVRPNLWMGGMYYGPHMTACVPEDQFDVVISMAGSSQAMRVNHPDVITHSFYIDDGKLGPMELDMVHEAKDLTLKYLDEGKKVLVRCQAGWNRSGLVVAMVLLHLGDHKGACCPRHAIGYIRKARGENALSNEWFVKYIHEENARMMAPVAQAWAHLEEKLRGQKDEV